MAKKIERTEAMSAPILGMLVMAIAGGLLVGSSFVAITAWPHPISVAPYYEDSLFLTGFAWGMVVGAFFGWIVGFLTDENHFSDVTYE
jgi:hypothetical protein